MKKLLTGKILVDSTLWLRKHPLVTGGLIVAYTLFILLMHDPLVNLSIFVMQGLSLPVYNQLVALIMIVTAIFGGGWTAINLWKHKNHRGVKLFFLIATLGFFVLHALFMFEMNIEIIHAAQYAVGGYLWYALTGRAGAAMILTLPIMLLDEWYQMNVLYIGQVEYLELNDVILDLLGVGTVTVLLWIAGVPVVKKPVLARPELYVLLLIVVAIAVAINTCYISLFPNETCPHTWLVLNSLENPDIFWQIHPFTQARYHVLSLPEAGTIGLGLIAFYSFSDELR